MNRSQPLKPRWWLIEMLAEVQAPPLPLVGISVVAIQSSVYTFQLNISTTTLSERQFLRGRLRRLQEFVEELSEKINVLF
jgi:hypothetical protein